MRHTRKHDNVLETLSQSPMGRKVLAEQAKHRHERRQEAAAEIERLQGELVETANRYDPLKEQAAAALKEAEAAVVAKRDALRAVKAEHWAARDRLSHQVAKLQGELRGMAVDAIDDALEQVGAAWDRTRLKPGDQVGPGDQGAMERLRQAREDLDALRTKPLSDDQAEKEVNRILATAPIAVA